MTSTPPANSGCTVNPVSYSLNTYACSQFCSTIHTVTGSYSITWQPPTGWVQTSISVNGNNVSFTPDAFSGGVLTATIHLPCGYTDKRTFNVSRPTPAPTFTASTIQACTSSASMSINPVCGAVDYTYTIVGDPGVTFTSNGQQALTSSSTSINFSIVGGSSNNTIKAKANYPNIISSVEAIATLNVGGPVISIAYSRSGSCNGTYQTWFLNATVNGPVTSWLWTVDNPSNGSWIIYSPNSPNTNVAVSGGGGISINATNSCGTSRNGVTIYSTCFSFSATPNPTTDNITVAAIESKDAISSNEKKPVIHEIKITDHMGNLKKVYKYPAGNSNIVLSLKSFSKGTYIIQAFDGISWYSVQIMKQ